MHGIENIINVCHTLLRKNPALTTTVELNVTVFCCIDILILSDVLGHNIES